MRQRRALRKEPKREAVGILQERVDVLGAAQRGGEGGESSLRSWLGELGIEEAYANFEAEGFTTLAEVVEAELTDDDLKELGLRLKARKLVKIELKKLPEAEPAGAPAPGPTPARKPASKPAAPEKVTEMPKIQMDDIIMLPNGGQMVGKDAWGTIIQTAVRRPSSR